MVSLCTQPAVVGDGSFNGTTAEDQFFGVQDAGGIVAIRITTTANRSIGLEVDHVQYGDMAAPVPTLGLIGGSIAMIAVLITGVGLARRRWA